MSLARLGCSPLIAWDVATKSSKHLFESQANDGITAIQISPDGKMLVSSCLDVTVKLWNLETGAEIRTLIKDSYGCPLVVTNPQRDVIAIGMSNRIEVWGEASNAIALLQ
jgi:WD40 repeat protein